MFGNAVTVRGEGAAEEGDLSDISGGFEGESARVSKVASTCARSVSGAWMCG